MQDLKITRRLAIGALSMAAFSLRTFAVEPSPSPPDAALPLPARTLLAEAAMPSKAPTGGAPPKSSAGANATTKLPASATLPDLAPLPGDGPSSALVQTPASAGTVELPNLDDLPPPTPEPQPEKPSQNVTINLINMLVQRGVLTHADADGLIKQAAADAARARAEAEADAAMLPSGGDGVRVTYVPETVKAQIRDEIKAEVLATARSENWASPRAFPEWTERVRWFGDFRLRAEGDFFDMGNDNTGAFPNFNSINSGSPFDTSGLVFSPQYNTDEERQRLRLRVRLGMDVYLEDGFSAGFRLATGDTSTPVSANQSLGAAGSGQGGNFSKYAIWLDRAFLKYEIGNKPRVAETPEADLKSPQAAEAMIIRDDVDWNVALSFGRFDNPFFYASDIIWDEDLGFDGVAIQARLEITEGITTFANAGIFPVFNTDFNFSSNNPDKFESNDKWLYGAQFGLDLKPDDDVRLRTSAAIYDFSNVEGRLSTPFIPLTAQDAGDTDHTRPTFAQKGNTYRALRDIIPSVLNDFGTSSQYQYFGLATPFRVLNYNARLDLDFFEPCQISLLGEYAKNLDFDADAINDIAVNNRGPTEIDEAVGDFEGGDTAWNVALLVGKQKFEDFGDWQASIGYRYVESDAVVDGFTESDFGHGGTNHKGYTIGASMALSQDVKIGIRWMSATEIAGPPLRSDIIMFDLSAKF